MVSRDLAPAEAVPALSQPDEDDGKRVPLTLICGFLGAGKSTFLKCVPLNLCD